MDFLEGLCSEVERFLGVSRFFEILFQGNYHELLTYQGITALIAPIIPLLVVLELTLGRIYKKPQSKVYKITFLIYIANRIIGRLIAIGMVALCIGFFSKYAPWNIPNTWYGFLIAYIIWEFAHYIYHYLGHKVRLFWCFHATHHTPEDMNLSVTYAHFFLEAPYADTIRTTICILLGVDPVTLFVIMFVDGTYGAFIHVGENLIRDARFGFLNKIMLTPSHHRVHHARNPLYIDTNYCNLLNIWDRVFGTYQEEQTKIKPEYGITRPYNSGNFWDIYFGEIVTLAKDVFDAPGLYNKLKYLVMPPGWSHLGDHKTATVIKKQITQNNYTKAID